MAPQPLDQTEAWSTLMKKIPELVSRERLTPAIFASVQLVLHRRHDRNEFIDSGTPAWQSQNRQRQDNNASAWCWSIDTEAEDPPVCPVAIPREGLVLQHGHYPTQRFHAHAEHTYNACPRCHRTSEMLNQSLQPVPPPEVAQELAARWSMFYDRRSDPWEQHSRLGHPSVADIQAEHRARAQSFIQQFGDRGSEFRAFARAQRARQTVE
jgi:hypothetical protein